MTREELQDLYDRIIRYNAGAIRSIAKLTIPQQGINRMETLKIITGLRQEGKTTELIQEYIEHFRTTYEAEGKTINLRESLVPVLIIAANVDFHKLIENTCNIAGIADTEGTLAETHVIERHNCHNGTIVDIYDIIHKHIVKYDCVFYIDKDLFDSNDVMELLEFMEKFPNTKCPNSFSIVATKERRKRDEQPPHTDNSEGIVC